eukprot:4658494-Prymnesium_polylepis.2
MTFSLRGAGLAQLPLWCVILFLAAAAQLAVVHIASAGAAAGFFRPAAARRARVAPVAPPLPKEASRPPPVPLRPSVP